MNYFLDWLTPLFTFIKIKKIRRYVKMPTCRDCKFYKEIDETKGDCYGHEVPADRDAEECPQNAFQPK
jgi:hypothetical protein